MNLLTFSIPVNCDVFCPICCCALLTDGYTTFQGMVLCTSCASLGDTRMMLRAAKRSYMASFTPLFDRSCGFTILVPDLPADSQLFKLWESNV